MVVFESRPPSTTRQEGKTLSFHVESVPQNEIDSDLLRVLQKGTLYAVGGRVRDEMLAAMGRSVASEQNLDYLVTGLSLDELLAALKPVGRAELVGSSFGVVKLAIHDETIDIALPRRERSVGVHHRDFEVEFGADVPLEDDLARRDFRINMMARDLRTGAVLDPFGGRADLEHARLDVLRAEAFVEDPLRVLRGAQFAARFDLTPTPRTLDAMRAAADLIPSVAPERVAEELGKLLRLAQRPSVGFELLREVSALHHVLPELMEGWQVEQNEYHRYTVYYHSLEACDHAPKDVTLRLAALLHDVGKPRTKEGPHFYRHESVGASMAREALARLRFSGETIDRVTHLVANHMYNSGDELTDPAIRRFINRVGRDAIEPLFALRHADVIASGLVPRDEAQQARFEARVHAELDAKRPFGVKDLAIGGADVIAVMRELGVADDAFQGDARVGAALKHCLETVLDDPSANESSALRAVVRTFLEASR